MESKEEEKNARTLLKLKKGEIQKKKPKRDQIGESVTILQPCDDKDLKMIKYYSPRKITKDVKDNFRKHFELKMIQLEESPSFHSHRDFVRLGKDWDTLLSQKIEGMKLSKEVDGRVADSLFNQLKANFGIELFVSHMTLYGYMYRRELLYLSPQVYFWNGDADAVGWYLNKSRGRTEYIIVDWKVVELLHYCTSSSAFGKHLHQCLVYARLLQLHLNLEYLPSILIVAISRNNGKDIQAGLFRDYPDECKSFLHEQFAWSIEQPKPIQNIILPKSKFLFNSKLKEGVVNGEKLLKDLFAKEAKVKDLLKAFGLNELIVASE